MLAAALNGIAVVHAYFPLFTGGRHASTVPLQSRKRERFAVLTLAVLILGGGLFPQPGVATQLSSRSLQLLQERELIGPSTVASRDPSLIRRTRPNGPAGAESSGTAAAVARCSAAAFNI